MRGSSDAHSSDIRPAPMPAAVFDFDKTLTTRHTFWRFLRALRGPLAFYLIALRLVPTVVRLLLGRISLLAAREKLIRLCLQGIPEQQAIAMGERFAAQDLPGWLRPEAMARLAWHQQRGHLTCLVSNSAEYYLAPWARANGVAHVCGSRFEARDGVLTGALVGDHCHGEEKVLRLRATLGDLDRYEIHAYGDSEGDRALLEAAAVPHYRTFRAGHALPSGWHQGAQTHMQRKPAMEDVLIVGAGPVGLALACELYRHGVPCRIVDKNAEPSTTSKAFVVHSRTLEMFEDMGCIDDMMAHGQEVHVLNIYSGGRRIVRFDFHVLDAPYPHMLSLPQSRIERVLEERLGQLGGKVERCVSVVDLEPATDGATVTLAREDDTRETVRARYVVGCDGAHSTVRNLMGERLEGSTYDREFLIADGVLTGVPGEREAHTFVSSGGYVMVFPLPGGLHRVVVDCPVGYCEGQPATLDHLHRRLAERGLPEARVSDTIWLSNTAFHRRMANSFRDGRVLLAGDAAHIHSPLGGQGMNTGLQDAYNLGWKLALVARGVADEQLLTSYDEERRTIAASVLAHTDAQTRMLITENPVRIKVRNALAPLVTRRRRVQSVLSGQASGLAARYPASEMVEAEPGSAARFPLLAALAVAIAVGVTASVPLGIVLGVVVLVMARAWIARPGSWGSAPRPGSRAPDMVLAQGADASPRRLFDVLHGKSFGLLVFCGDAAPGPLREAARDLGQRFGDLLRVLLVQTRADVDADAAVPGSQVIADPDGAVHRRYGAQAGAAFLVRPDGYVALRRASLRGQEVADFLARTVHATPATSAAGDADRDADHDADEDEAMHSVKQPAASQ